MDRRNEQGGHHPPALSAPDPIETCFVSKREHATQRTPLPPGYLTLWTTVALDLVGFGIIVPILGRYAERFGANGFQVGLLGRLSDRIGRKPVIVLSLIGTAVGSIVTGVAGSLWVLFAGRIIDGASGGSLSVAQAAVADISTPEQRPRLVGMMGAAFGVGFVLGPAIGGLAALGGPHVPFFVAGALAGANAIAAMIRLPETRRPDARPAPAHGGVRAPRSEVLRQLAFVGFLSTLAFTAFEATFALFGHRRFGFTEGSSAAVFLGVGVVLVIIQGGVYARLVERLGVGVVLRNALVVIAFGLVALAAATTWPVLIVALVLLAVGQGCASPSITTIVAERAPADQRGLALGFQQSAYAVARVAGPPVAGLLFDQVGVPAPYLAAAVLCFAAAGLVVFWGLQRSVMTAATA
jgi:MFS transporter, DHA1 family, tetracycline resistance protein